MSKLAIQSLLMLVFLSVVTGILYPLTVTLISQAMFSHQANGSLIENASGQVVGSELLAQQFLNPKYFSSRPSATGGYPYNAAGSGGSNLGPTNKDLLQQMKSRIENLEKTNGGEKKIPVDLVTTSGSGLDPHISPEAADYQVARVAKARNLDQATVMKLVKQFEETPQLNILGDARVNVLKLNIALDGLK